MKKVILSAMISAVLSVNLLFSETDTLSSPRDLYFMWAGEGSGVLNWESDYGQEGVVYEIYMSKKEDGKKKIIGQSDNAFAMVDVKENTWLYLKTLKDGKSSDFSSGLLAGPVSAKPEGIASFTGRPVSQSAIEWKWAAAEGADGYFIYEGNSSNLLKKLIGYDSTEWKETGLEAGTNYIRTVKTFNQSGISVKIVATAASTLKEGEIAESETPEEAVAADGSIAEQKAQQVKKATEKAAAEAPRPAALPEETPLKVKPVPAAVPAPGPAAVSETAEQKPAPVTGKKPEPAAKPAPVQAQGKSDKEMADIINKFSFAINFRTDSDQILDGHIPNLNNIAKVIKENNLRARIEGHTCNLGPAAHNKDLSKRRAKSVRDYLVSKGVPASNLTYEGYGSERPAADNSTKLGRYRNRRIEFVLITPEGKEIRTSLTKE
ncbi:MAG: OmpA family protein [Elusimicrobia bacterium]|nr:OmpA family protein [Elusimicrobiota bacterium]